MADLTQIVLSWNNSLRCFAIINNRRTPGTQESFAQLELERVRLAYWGDSNGISSCRADKHGHMDERSSTVNAELRDVQERTSAVSHLSSIERLFENPSSLVNRFGLKKESLSISRKLSRKFLAPTGSTDFDAGNGDLEPIFKDAYGVIRRSAIHFSRSTAVTAHARWNVNDLGQFAVFITQLRNFVDALTRDRNDVLNMVLRAIDSADDRSALRILRQATESTDRDISLAASVRLEALSAPPRISSPPVILPTVPTAAPAVQARSLPAAPSIPKPAAPITNVPPSSGDSAGPRAPVPPALAEAASARPAATTSARATHPSTIQTSALRSASTAPAQLPSQAANTQSMPTRSGPAPAPANTALTNIRTPVSNTSPAPISSLDTVESQPPPPYQPSHQDLILSLQIGIVPGPSDLSRRLLDLDAVLARFEKGALICRLKGGAQTARRWGSSYWLGEQYASMAFAERNKGCGTLSFKGLALYHRSRFFERNEQYPQTDEDFVAFDVESHPEYPHLTPGTVTVEGFGLEAWDNEELVLPDIKIVFTSRDPLGLIRGATILRRLDELKSETLILGQNPELDLVDLREFTGQSNLSIISGDYSPKNQVYDLFQLLNRSEIFADFSTTFTTAGMVQAIDAQSPGMWFCLWQFVLGKEVLRRLSKAADIANSGLNVRTLATLIVADRWLNGVNIVLAPKDFGERPLTDLSARDKPYDLANKSIQFHSKVHESQVAALLRFAELLNWPHISETRNFTADLYKNLRTGTTVSEYLWDWLFGTVMPGKWCAFSIMMCLFLCTPSLKVHGTPVYYNNCVALPRQTYWRARTILGRVLGGLEGVKSVCGWIGPCPPIDIPVANSKFVRLKARDVLPPQADTTIRLGGYGASNGSDSLRLRDRENVHAYLSEVMNESKWTSPSPPVQQQTNCTLQSIKLAALPLPGADRLSAIQKEIQQEYRPSLVFKLSTNQTPVSFTLYYNPVFVSAPPCFQGPHKCHARELPNYQRRKPVKVSELKGLLMADVDDVIVINATGEGEECLARAWCAEEGKHALVRRDGGPCFLCAYNAASKKGLGIGVLIWSG